MYNHAPPLQHSILVVEPITLFKNLDSNEFDLSTHHTTSLSDLTRWRFEKMNPLNGLYPSLAQKMSLTTGLSSSELPVTREVKP
jgi:hypothetical protein